MWTSIIVKYSLGVVGLQSKQVTNVLGQAAGEDCTFRAADTTEVD